MYVLKLIAKDFVFTGFEIWYVISKNYLISRDEQARR